MSRGASVLGDFFSEIVLPTPAAIKINGIRITANGVVMPAVSYMKDGDASRKYPLPWL